MQGRCLQALCHAAFLLSGHGFGFFLQLTQFLKVREQAKTVGEHLSKAVDPGRKALPSWRAEEGLSYRSGWDLKPALSSSLPLQATAGQFPKARAGRFGFPVGGAKCSTGFHWILFMALASEKEILQYLSFSICTACSIQALTLKIENKMV